MSDVYIEDPDGRLRRRFGTVQRLRAEVGRAAHRIERAVHDARDNAVGETRYLAHMARRRINSQLGLYAACAFGAGVGLGLLAAMIAALRARDRG